MHEPDRQTSDPVDTGAIAALRSKVDRVLGLIRPAVQDDGGDVELVSVSSDGVGSHPFARRLRGCPSAHLTLHHGIERALRAELGDGIRVEAVTTKAP
jgi:Fe-S cluster biogenesis protein NfuA